MAEQGPHKKGAPKTKIFLSFFLQQAGNIEITIRE